MLVNLADHGEPTLWINLSHIITIQLHVKESRILFMYSNGGHVNIREYKGLKFNDFKSGREEYMRSAIEKLVAMS